MRWLIIFLLFIFLVESILASCSEGQIDINSATLTELDAIYGVGNATAQNIIDSRPFDSIEDLIKVTYIGETKLEKIKEEGLACVEEDSNSEEKEIDSEEQEDLSSSKDPSEEDEEEIEENLEDKVIELNEEIEKKSQKKETELETIELNSATSQTIKSGNYMKSLSEKNYAKYGLGLFCVLLGGLFAIRKSRLRKNEFR